MDTGYQLPQHLTTPEQCTCATNIEAAQIIQLVRLEQAVSAAPARMQLPTVGNLFIGPDHITDTTPSEQIVALKFWSQIHTIFPTYTYT